MKMAVCDNCHFTG